ncbi:MAG TPA: type II toxin-antitoxin system RelE/ParE family toxin [Acidobacteriaceae bacterium]
MPWDVEVSDEFRDWYEALGAEEQDSVAYSVNLLRFSGPDLGRPFVDSVWGSRHSNMKELRVQHKGRPWRVLFAFDPRRMAYLILAGDKTGNPRWYKINVPRADAIYDRHLREIQ